MPTDSHELKLDLVNYLLRARCTCGGWESGQVGPDDRPPTDVFRRMQEQHRQHVTDATGHVAPAAADAVAGGP